MTENEVMQIVLQFARDLAESRTNEFGGADNALLEKLYGPQPLAASPRVRQWLHLALYGAGLKDSDADTIHDIAQSLAEMLFALPGRAAYSVPDEWARTDMGALWWAAIVRSAGGDLITQREAADMLGVDVRRISERIKRGALRGYTNPASKRRQGRVLVRRSDIEALRG